MSFSPAQNSNGEGSSASTAAPVADMSVAADDMFADSSDDMFADSSDDMFVDSDDDMSGTPVADISITDNVADTVADTADTANPVAAAVPAISALQYLQGVDGLPELIKATIGIPKERERVSQFLLNLPIQRELSFQPSKIAKDKKTKVKFDPTDNTHIGTIKLHFNVKALFVFVTGDELTGDEACCEKTNGRKCKGGIFPISVVPVEGNYGSELPSCKSTRTCSRQKTAG